MKINKWMVSAVGVVALLAGVMVAGGGVAYANHEDPSTFTAVTCTPNPVDFGDSATDCEVKVTANEGTVNPSGTVTLWRTAVETGENLGQCTLDNDSTLQGRSKCTVGEVGGDLMPGSHVLIAVYSGTSTGHNFTQSQDSTNFVVRGGSITIAKACVVDDPNGSFDLELDGVAILADAECDDNTGPIMLAPGDYEVSETINSAGQYSTRITCDGGDNWMAGTLLEGVTVADGDEIVCTIENTLQVTGTDFPCKAAPAISAERLRELGVRGATVGRVQSEIASYNRTGHSTFSAVRDRPCGSIEDYNSEYRDPVRTLAEQLAQP